MTVKRISVFLMALLVCAAYRAESQSITAKTCNASDVQAAFNAVTSSTTTVSIPAGTCTWTTQVSLTIPSGNTSLSVLGAGNITSGTNGGDQTIFVDNDTTDSNYLLLITTNSNTASVVRVAGFTIQNGTGGIKDNGVLAIGGSSHNFRADHLHLNGIPGTGTVYTLFRLTNWIYGVIDHIEMDGQIGIQVWDDNYNNSGDGAGHASWADSSNFGSANFVYIENNILNAQPAGAPNYISDCYAGGRFVVRFNTVNNAGVDVHPTGGAGSMRGCRAVEVYQNTFSGSNSAPTYAAYWDSSGTSLVWGNSAPAGYEHFIDLHSMRVSNSTYPQTAPPNGWGYCGTSFNGAGSAWDQNSNSMTGYRCLDEPGAGKSDLLQNWFPTMCDVTSGQCAALNYNGSWPNQALEPIYEWLDSYTPATGYSSPLVSNGSASALAQNVDWYQNNPSFTGKNGGVGSGPLTARPSSCTQGVGYWATDQGNWNTSGSGGQGELFVCSSSGAWALYYTPYAYPHPLDKSGPTLGIPQNVQTAVP